MMSKISPWLYASALPGIMLYELMLMALAGGEMSSIEYRFLEIFKQHHRIDDCDFDEILERAKTTYREVQKTIALVLE